MATASNSKYVSFASSIAPDLRAGWTIRILDYKDLHSLVAVIHEYTSFSFTQELSATGQGSLTMDTDSPFWARSLANGKPAYTLKDHQYVIEAWDRDTPRFAWFAQTVEETIIGDDETRAIILSGPGIAQALTWAPINRPGWPKAIPIVSYYTSDADGSKTPMRRDFSHSNALPAYKWQFPTDWATMKMWYIVFRAAQARGLLKFMSLSFTADRDSDKKKWIWVNTQSTQAGEGYQFQDLNQNLLEFLNDCTGQDYTKWFGQRLEWLMDTGFHLQVRQTIGQKRPNVRFYSGNILSDQRTRDREAIYSRVIAVDVDGNETVVIDKKSIADWNLREQRNEANKQITDNNLRSQLASRYLEQSKDQKDQWTLKIAYDDPNRVPYRHFFVGDTVGFTVPGPNADPLGYEPVVEEFRVMAITIAVNADSVVPECEITLRSLLDIKQNRIQQEITKLVNAPTLNKLADVADVKIPEIPKTKSTLVFNPETKKWEAVPVSSAAGGGGIYIGATDPAAATGSTVKAGDFWLETYG